MRPRWDFTVASARYRVAAISVLDRPRPTWTSTSRSRALSRLNRSSRSAPLPSGMCGRKFSSRRRVMRGDTTASPAATLRIAVSNSSGLVFFSRKPEAPAWSPAKAYSSRSKVVRMSTLLCGEIRMTCRVASIPSVPGIRTSMRTTSGRSSRARRTAWTPSAASPTGAMSGWASRMVLKAIRSSPSSSAIRMRIVMRTPPRRCRGGGGCSLASRRPEAVRPPTSPRRRPSARACRGCRGRTRWRREVAGGGRCR